MRLQGIREAAKSTLTEFWLRRADIAGAPTNIDDWFPVRVNLLITEGLGINLYETNEIAVQPESPNALAVDVAGVLERFESGTRITLATKFNPACRRFTAGHEIGHELLHPGLIFHRDRPLSGAERAHTERPLIEREADLFAAELLMPSRFVRKVFAGAFGGVVGGSDPDDDLAGELSVGTGRNIGALELAKNRRLRSMLVAETSSYRGRRFVSLADRFGVTATAMAIQLEDLNLVV